MVNLSLQGILDVVDDQPLDRAMIDLFESSCSKLNNRATAQIVLRFH